MDFKLDNSDAYAALKIKDFKWFVSARFLLTFGVQMQSVIVGWQIYQLTHDALSLGLIGLAEAIPFISFSLFTGYIADVISRKKIIVFSNFAYFLCAMALLVVSTRLDFLLREFGVFPIYIIIFITGISRGFLSPAQGAFAAQLVPPGLFGNASTWNSLAWQTAAVLGPAIGGLVYGFSGIGNAYIMVVILTAAGLTCFTFVSKKPVPERIVKESVLKSLSHGLKFVFSNQIVVSAITLDMFAVFFGGATSVLPIFTDQVLHTGAEGLGLLRAAPAIGAIIMSIVQTQHPLFKYAGRNLLFCVFGFGISIICFAISKNFILSLFVLMLSGMFDNVSVIMRSTIIQLYTPNEMRGRVSAVNGIFIGSSNELGSFESGVAAKLLGLIPSVIFGGSMSLIVVAAVRRFAPKLKKLKL
jgi:MFS family permease